MHVSYETQARASSFKATPNLRTPVYTLFFDFLMMKDQSEVCTLSGQGKVWTPIRTITARHSLPPISHIRLPMASPYGSVSTCLETIGLTTFRIGARSRHHPSRFSDHPYGWGFLCPHALYSVGRLLMAEHQVMSWISSSITNIYATSCRTR